MPEEEHEPLQDGDLDEHEPGAQRAEVHEERKPRRRTLASGERERNDDEEHDERARDAHQREQCAQPIAEEHRPSKCDLELVGKLGGVKEEWPIVGGRAHVLRVLGVEALAVGSGDQAAVVGGGFHAVGRLCRGHSRRVQHAESEPVAHRAQAADLVVRERRFLQQERGHTIVLHDREA